MERAIEVSNGTGPMEENLLPPYDFKGRVPEDDAWLPSKFTFFWMRPLFRRAAYLSKHHTGLQQDDLLPMPRFDHGEPIISSFERRWATTAHENVDRKSDDTKARQQTDRVRKALLAVLGVRFWIAGAIKMFNSALQFSFPILLNQILKFIEDNQDGKILETDPWSVRYRGYWLSAVLFVFIAAKAVTENAYFYRVIRSGYQARVAVSVAVYNKSLRLSNAERQSTTLGELVNLMQVDASKIELFVPQFHVLWDGILQITGYIAILYVLIGWSCFVGLGVMIAAIPLQGVVMARLFGLNRELVVYTDARVKTTNEALQGIQSVKMFAWETNFAEAVGASRKKELGFLGNVAYLRAANRAYITALPGIVAVVSFIAYAYSNSGSDFAASTLFAAIVAFDQLRFPLLFYPVSLAQLSQASVSAARVQNFLEMQEIQKGNSPGNAGYVRDDIPSKSGAGEIEIQNATIYWRDPKIPLEESLHSKRSRDDDKSDITELDIVEESGEVVRYPKPILEDISIYVKPGELCAVVGKVGSGKSTLCSAILNETLLTSGTISLKGKVAYASQSPWILNASLRDNILFGLPYNKERYDRVISVCQLNYDLEMLNDGDLTEIGEKGINLSGGQKQRVSVARAAYSDVDTIILDDPLSALDPAVAKQLFDECIVCFMKGKTRLLVTNQLQFLKSCDTVVALGSRRVIEQGPFAELIADEFGEITRLLKNNALGDSVTKCGKLSNGAIGSIAKRNAEAKPTKLDKEAGMLVTKEERLFGAVSLSVYRKYILAGGGYLIFMVVYFGFILSGLTGIAVTSWVSYWTSDAEYQRHSKAFYLILYAAFSVLLGVFTFLRTYLLVWFGVKASERLHRNLFDSILRAPTSFFDTTPIGRILSRFSKDLYAIDIELTDHLDFFLFASLNVIMSIGVIVFVTPWFGLAVPPLAFLYVKVLNYFRDVSRETKRLDNISRSPVYAQFSETLGGLSTIRAFGVTTRFVRDFEGKIDENTRAYYNSKAADRWLGLRLEMIGSVVAGLAGFFASHVAISGSVSGQESDSNFSSLAGLSLTTAISVTSLLNWCVRTFAMLEAAMSSCERVLHYTENIPREAPWTAKELEDFFANRKNTSMPPSSASDVALKACDGKAASFGSSWPENGRIVLKHLCMRYRPETPLVLKGLDVVIEGGDRVGVVGRTGSGKVRIVVLLCFVWIFSHTATPCLQ
jgi:ATP-binding cassette, subfamily C (CFTR/MRP), member 1